MRLTNHNNKKEPAICVTTHRTCIYIVVGSYAKEMRYCETICRRMTLKQEISSKHGKPLGISLILYKVTVTILYQATCTQATILRFVRS